MKANRKPAPLSNNRGVAMATGKRGCIKKALALLALPMLFGPLAPLAASAEDAYPSKPIKIIVNYPAGGPLDLLARAVADDLQKALKQPAYVDNRPGAGGNIGASAVAKADPDGYTILFTLDSTFTINPSLFQSMPFQLSDFKPLMLLGSIGQSIAVHPSLGVNSLQELIVKGKQTSIMFSSSGNGGPGHINTALLEAATGIKVDHIPYKGAPPAAMALLSGEVQAGILTTPGVAPHYKNKRLKLLAVTGKQRSSLVPDVPTVGELGMPDLEFSTYFLAMLPAKTPTAVTDVLQKQMAAFLKRPEAVERLRELDFVPSGLTGQAVVDQLQQNKERYAKVIKASGMKID